MTPEQILELKRLQISGLKRMIDETLKGRSARELAETDWRAYRRVRDLRIDLARALVYERHAADEETARLVRLFNDPKTREVIANFNARVDISVLDAELSQAVDDVTSDELGICSSCQQLVSRSGLEIQIEQPLWHCRPCAEEIWNRPSAPPENGILSALTRARRHGLPATLTEAAWQRTVEHFEDRCAYCERAWCFVEHATPIERGGPTSLDNCLPACRSCNVRKGSQTIEEYLAVGWINRERVTCALNWLRQHGRALE